MARSIQGKPKMARQVKSKVKSMLINFFDVKEFVHKKFGLAGQTVKSAYHCDVLRRLHANVGRFCPELWRQRDNAPLHTSFLTRKFLTKRHHDCRHPVLEVELKKSRDGFPLL
jgi:hypothetical protein